MVLTASHNPATDNGIKFFSPTGAKLTDADEARIEALLESVESQGPIESSGDVGGNDAVRLYCEHLQQLLPA